MHPPFFALSSLQQVGTRKSQKPHWQTLAEQQAIVERVNKLMTMIDDLEKQVTERKE